MIMLSFIYELPLLQSSCLYLPVDYLPLLASNCLSQVLALDKFNPQVAARALAWVRLVQHVAPVRREMPTSATDDH